ALYVIRASELAAKAGNPRTVNVVMLGALAATGLLPFPAETLLEAVKKRVPSHALAENVKAFQLGFEEMLNTMKK
ncbi:MAG: pyruvate ferredoxin oxidoreductase, partial [Thermoprotei archaeon]